jgi:hypothetical protein
MLLISLAVQLRCHLMLQKAGSNRLYPQLQFPVALLAIKFCNMLDDIIAKPTQAPCVAFCWPQ